MIAKFFSLLCLIVSFSFTKEVEFTILTFNDVYDIHPKVTGLGGFANFQTILENERKKWKNTFTTMNGDFLFPSILSTYDRAKHRIELLNSMGVDLVVLGNHEFDFGPQVVLDRIKESKFPWLGANAYNLKGQYFSGKKQALIKEIDGVKIGFFGIVTNDTPVLSSCENEVIFTPITFTAKKMCKELKSMGADVIVALTHLFIDEDLSLAREVPEIDVILGGHDHDPIMWHENNTLIMKTGQNAYFLGRVSLRIVKNENSPEKTMVFPSWEIVLNRGHKPSTNIQALVDKYDRNFKSVGSKRLTILDVGLDSRHATLRSKESTFGNLVTDALRHEHEADCAIMSGGIIRGDKLYVKGTELSYEDLLSELAFDNENIVIRLKGINILQALENGVSHCEVLAGKFPQVSGIQFSYSKKNKPGQRIKEVFINGKPLSLQKYYTLATNTYNASGGDGYVSFSKGEIIKHPKQAGRLIETVKKYIEKNPVLNGKPEGRILVEGAVLYPESLFN